jgi:hypothetical protein
MASSLCKPESDIPAPALKEHGEAQILVVTECVRVWRRESSYGLYIMPASVHQLQEGKV